MWNALIIGADIGQMKGETMNKEDIKALIEDINVTLLPSGELLVDTEYANEAKSVRLMDREGFTRIFEERKTGHWIMHIDDLFPADSTQECSECHEWQFIYLGNDDNYCPNCGAKMERSKK